MSARINDSDNPVFCNNPLQYFRGNAAYRGISSKVSYERTRRVCSGFFNPLNTELNPICYLLALLGAHHFFHVSRIRVKSLILRLLMSYIYIYISSLRVNKSALCSGCKQVKG